MAIRISKNVKIILYVLLGVLVLGGSGYLIWVINNKDTVAPTDSDAACPEGCYWHASGQRCVKDGGSCWWECNDGTKTLVPEGACENNGGYKLGLQCDQCVTSGGAEYTDITKCQTQANKQNSVLDPEYLDHNACPLGEKKWVCREVTGGFNLVQESCTRTVPVTTTYTLKYLTGSNGTLTGNTTQTVKKGESGTPVTAVPNEGYTFSHWERDGERKGSSNPRTDTNVQEDITVTARYAPLSVDGGICEDDKWVITPTDTYTYGTNPDLRVENRDEQGIDLDSIVVKFDGIERARCTSAVGETCYVTNVVNGYTRIIMQFEGYLLGEGEHTIIFRWSDGDGNEGCYKSKTFTVVPEGQQPVCGNDLCEAGEDSVNCPEDCGSGVPQTGLLDTVLGRVSIGFAFIFLGGLVSQYSKLNYMYESMQEKGRFRRDISREKRMSRSRDKFEKRVK